MLGRPLAVLFLASALSGCAASLDPIAPGTESAPEPFSLYLTGGPGLTWDAPVADEPEAVGGGGFFTQWGAPDGYAAFTGDPLGETLLVTGPVLVKGHVRADGPAVQAGAFPHLVAYFGFVHPDFGNGAFMNAAGSGNVEPLLGPGEVVPFEIELVLPRDGLVLERGVLPRVLLSTVMTQDEHLGDVVFLVNSTEAPARVEFTALRVPDPPALEGRGGVVGQGVAAGTAYVGSVEGVSQQTSPLHVGADTVRLRVVLETDAAAGFGDLDLAVLDASGEVIVQGVTPMGVERVLLYPVHLVGASAVRVTNYGSAAAAFTLDVDPYSAATGSTGSTAGAAWAGAG